MTNNIEEKKEDKKIDHDVLKKVIIGLVCFVILIGIFFVGILVGETKARFSYRWAENYHQNFGGPRQGFMGDTRNLPRPNDFIAGHGTFGEILKINPSADSRQAGDFIIKGQNDMEKLIMVNNKTVIQNGKMNISFQDLNTGDQALVIGSPNDQGQIEGKLIRIFENNERFK